MTDFDQRRARFESQIDSLQSIAPRAGLTLRQQLIEFGNQYVTTLAGQQELTDLIQRLNQPQHHEREVLVRDVSVFLDQIKKEYDPHSIAHYDELMEKARLRAEEKYNKLRTVAVRCRGITKLFDEFKLGPIDFEIRRGEITGVAGQNANGKTTFFRILAGELPHNGGTLEYPFLDQISPDINWHTVKRNIAYVPQDLPRWYGSLRANLEYEAAIHGLRGEQNRMAVAYIVERLRLSEHIDMSWSKLSGGYRWRFALARALIWKPSIMILDEPLANLDPAAQITVLHDIQQAARNVSHPIAVLISSQHILEIESISDRIVFLRRGKAKFNNYTRYLGDDRKNNVYWLNVSIDSQTLRDIYADKAGIAVTHDGVHHVLTTDLEITESDVLRPLSEKRIPIRSFENISNSTLPLFEMTER